MEEIQNQPLFNLSIEPVTKAHLSEAARWARFLSIIGFIFLGIGAVALIFGGVYFAGVLSNYESVNNRTEVSGYNSGFAIGMIAYYLVVVILMFFAYLFLYRFGKRMKTALNGNSQQMLDSSFQNLKILFRYIGILTIIGLVFFVLILMVAIMAGSFLGTR